METCNSKMREFVRVSDDNSQNPPLHERLWLREQYAVDCGTALQVRALRSLLADLCVVSWHRFLFVYVFDMSVEALCP